MKVARKTNAEGGCTKMLKIDLLIKALAEGLLRMDALAEART